MTDYGTELPAIQIPLLGNSAAVGLFSLLHIVPAALSVAFMLMAPIFEFRGRTDPFDRDLAHSMTRFTVVVFSVSTVLAVIMVELMIGLFPVTTMWMWNHFRVPILFGVVSFILMLLALYPYYHFWERLRETSITLHIILGGLAAFFMLPWVLMLDGMGAFMLTPVQDAGMWERLLNPTWLPLVIHRMVGNLVIAGYTLAAYGAWRASNPGDPALQSYYQHLLHRGWVIGLGAFLLQPFTGLLYALAIHRAAPDAQESVIAGPYAPWLYVQLLFLSLFFLGNDVLTKRLRTPNGRQTTLVGYRISRSGSATPDCCRLPGGPPDLFVPPRRLDVMAAGGLRSKDTRRIGSLSVTGTLTGPRPGSLIRSAVSDHGCDQRILPLTGHRPRPDFASRRIAASSAP
ncbi:MAG: hypothetical protein QM771_08960 [Nitrospira sp.]